MKKNRSSFFNSTTEYYNTPNQNIPNMFNQSGFYMGQNPNINYDDINSRLSKLERQVSRLEYQIKMIDQNNNISYSKDLTDTSNVNNMYMI